jgi:hypothetical protein
VGKAQPATTRGALTDVIVLLMWILRVIFYGATLAIRAAHGCDTGGDVPVADAEVGYCAAGAALWLGPISRELPFRESRLLGGAGPGDTLGSGPVIAADHLMKIGRRA